MVLDFIKTREEIPEVGEEGIKKEPEKIEVFEENAPEKILQTREETSEFSMVEAERINARLDAIAGWLNQFYERFLSLSERIGEMRALVLANEKEISILSEDSMRAIGIVKEIEPERIVEDNQRLESKIKILEEKIEANRQFIEDIMIQFAELRRKSEVFVGTEALLKLNEEIKKDLLDVKKIVAEAKEYADKSEGVFVEFKKAGAQREKSNEIVNSLDASFSELRGEFDEFKGKYADIVDKAEFNDFKKNVLKSLASLEKSISRLKK